MELKKLYTAVGRLERESNGCGHSCPVIVLGGERYMVDMQEMVVWTALNWRISKWDDISCQPRCQSRNFYRNHRSHPSGIGRNYFHRFAGVERKPVEHRRLWPV